jgi:hypothetical protein
MLCLSPAPPSPPGAKFWEFILNLRMKGLSLLFGSNLSRDCVELTLADRGNAAASSEALRLGWRLLNNAHLLKLGEAVSDNLPGRLDSVRRRGSHVLSATIDLPEGPDSEMRTEVNFTSNGSSADVEPVFVEGTELLGNPCFHNIGPGRNL